MSTLSQTVAKLTLLWYNAKMTEVRNQSYNISMKNKSKRRNSLDSESKSLFR